MQLCMGCMEQYSESEQVCPHCGYIAGTMPEQGNHMMPGTRLHGRYIIGKVIGYGGFGVTYIGFDEELNRKVAIKEYMPNEFSGRVQGENKVTVYEGDRAEQFQSGLEKFVSEARRLAKFQDIPGVVQIFDSFAENNTAYIVMEYLEGETLKSLLKREGKLPLDKALNIIMPILSSLKVVHKSDMIHRDIAPDNIMVCNNGSVKLIDFGASRFATATHSRSLTVLIKQGYAPAEQYNSRGDQGPWTDVYALAAVFYKMLTGVTPEDSMERKAHDIMKPPSKEGAKVGKNIDIATMNALNISVEYRTKSMEDFEKELLSDEEVTRIVEPDKKSDVGKIPSWVKVLAGCAAAAIVVFVGLIMSGVITIGSNQRTAEFIQEEGITYVPGFVNLLYDQAGELAESNYVTIQLVDSVFSDDIPMDMICSQDLQSGTEVLYWDVVRLVVSAGVEMIDVPNVTGALVDDAIATLDELGLQYEIVKEYSNYSEGYIVSQSIDPLSRVSTDSKIVITVSKGPDPNEEIDTSVTVIMPDLVGMDNIEAQRLLAGLKISINPVMEYSSKVPEGKVISQSEEAGTELHQGDSVTLTISLGQQMINVPYVIVKSEEEARRLLTDKGLVVSVSYEFSDTVKKGNVISQSIEANTQVSTGTTIQLVVSSGPSVVMVAVPNLVGKSETEAASTLSGLGLVGSVSYEYSDTVASGYVISQSTAPSTRVEESTAISYVVSSGRNPGKNWSGWVSQLPSGVNASSYEIETEYRYRDLATTSSTDSSMAGWNLVRTESDYGEYGEWSSWSDTAATASDSRDVQTQTLYQSRVKETTTSGNSSMAGWTQTSSSRSESAGAWSEWSRTPVSASEDASGRTEVETRTGSERVQTGTRYVYHHYYIPGGKYWPEGGYTVYYTYSANFASGCGYEEWATFDSRTGQDSSGAEHGNWWFDHEEAVYTDQDYTEYRSRRVNYSYSYSYEKWGDWSDWSTNAVTANATTEVNTKTQYRYRDRSLVYTYYYEKWGDWSEWKSGSGTGSSTREVEVRYRYRLK